MPLPFSLAGAVGATRPRLPEDDADAVPRDVDSKMAGLLGLASPGPTFAARHSHSRNLQPTPGTLLLVVPPVW